MNKKKPIIKDIEKKFTTTIIGALSRFEESFGYLWENDTEASQAYYQLWMNTRNNVLNHGNHQLRSALYELEKYIEHEDRYPHKYKFSFKPETGEENGN